ncbi:MAG: DUF3656 domain-containing protein [Okeania sp. SIO3B3]|nr:DUF3656 domain-containing protein [Okeania sp. SIO3B3]
MAAELILPPDQDPIKLEWAEAPEPAGKRPLEKEAMDELFRATRNGELKAGAIEVDIRGDWFIPMSVLKKRRREFWEKVEEMLPPDEGAGPLSISFPMGRGVPAEKTVLTVFAPSGASGKNTAGEDEIVNRQNSGDTRHHRCCSQL